jgi:hypothetical protein
MNRIKTAVLPLAFAVTALVPLGLSGPAQASTTDSGCTVTPVRPVFAGTFTLGGVPYVDYEIIVTCGVGLVAETYQERLESDLQNVEGDPVDDFIGSSSHTFDFTAAGGTQSVNVRRSLPTTGPATEGPAEELYQSLKFRVTSGPVTSNWTTPELTPARAIFH